MNPQAMQLIHQYRGYVYEAVGLVSAFFADAQQAQACADALRNCVADVLIFGMQVTFPV